MCICNTHPYKLVLEIFHFFAEATQKSAEFGPYRAAM